MTDFNWSPWHALEGAGRNRDISPDQGLYRIRRAGREALDYVGQTGMGLRRRLEIENDMIGAHVAEVGKVPVAQFLG